MPPDQAISETLRIGIKPGATTCAPQSDEDSWTRKLACKLSDRIHFRRLVIRSGKAHSIKAMRTLLLLASLSVLSLSSLLVASCSKSASQPAPATPIAADPVTKTPEPAPIVPTEVEPPAAGWDPNLQVLPKDWGESQVKDYMRVVSIGLGVQCDHCHNLDSMAADTEKKTEARAMMEMTRGLDTEFFGGKGKLTCGTCHKGHEEPQGL